MKLFNIFPLDIFENPDQSIPAFLSSLLIRSNFSVNTRNNLGWRGLSQSIKNGDGWTCKIKNQKGVYGIYFHESNSNENKLTGTFNVCYFPDANEDITENFSIEAEMITKSPTYSTLIREFLCYPQFTSLFNIAEIEFEFHKNEDKLGCSFKALKKTCSTSKSGFKFSNNDDEVFVLKPGEADQNLMTFDLAFPFFEVLATSVSFNLKESPSNIIQIENKINVTQAILADEIHLNYGITDSKHDFAKYYSLNKNSIISQWDNESQKPKPFKNSLWWNAHLTIDSKTNSPNKIINPDLPQFILLSGFLGSGKTSFLKHFIEYHTSNNRFVAVIQNEIGESGLDAKLLEDDYAVLEMDEGCVCCSLIGQLQKGIKQILEKHQPDVIILETTGLANPQNMLSEIHDLDDLIQFGSVTTIVDGKNIESLILESKIIEAQIKSANVILLNKTDLIDEIQKERIYKLLKDKNPLALIAESINGDINPALLYSSFPEKKILKTSPSKDKKIFHSHKNDNLSSIKISLKGAIKKQQFVEFIKTFPKGIYRSKGIIEFEDDNKTYIFQYVNGNYELNRINKNKTKEYFIVIIGKTNSLNQINQKLIN
jgi:G3E family GTPase